MKHDTAYLIAIAVLTICAIAALMIPKEGTTTIVYNSVVDKPSFAPPSEKPPAVSTNVSAAESEKVNINRASVAELCRLYGVSEKLAQEIIKYRERGRVFRRAEDIMLVKGIARNVYENNKHIIVVE